MIMHNEWYHNVVNPTVKTHHVAIATGGFGMVWEVFSDFVKDHVEFVLHEFMKLHDLSALLQGTGTAGTVLVVTLLFHFMTKTE